MKAIIWADQALQDLADIDDWFEHVAPEFAERVGSSAIAAGRFIAEHPGIGQVVGNDGERKWRVKGTDYKIFYQVTATTVEILRLRHAREDWKPPL